MFVISQYPHPSHSPAAAREGQLVRGPIILVLVLVLALTRYSSGLRI